MEYWTARELMPLLGYTAWRNFHDVVKKAQKACLNSAQDVENHFADIGKMVHIGSGTVRKVDDFKLVGELPENLKPEKHIREVKKEIKFLEKQAQKALLPEKTKTRKRK